MHKLFWILEILLQMDFLVGQCPEVPRSADFPECVNATIETTYVQDWGNGSLSLKISYDFGPLTAYEVARDSVSLCIPLSPQLRHCADASIYRAGDYNVENHTLFHGGAFVAGLGDHYVDGAGNAVACKRVIHADRKTPRCHFVRLKRGDKLVANGSLELPALDRPRYTVSNETGDVTLCYPLSVAFLNCDPRDRRVITPYHYIHRPNLGLYYLNDDQSFGPGDYYGGADGDMVLCVKDSAMQRVCQALVVLTDVCLVLAYVYQLVAPKFTIHRKCFLCHNLSLVVFYLWHTCLVFQLVPQSRTGQYVLFVAGYFSRFAAVSWLLVAGYDICRTFARLGAAPRGTRHHNEFLCYSLVGWGAPSAFLSATLVVDSSPTLQRALSLHPRFITGGWFRDPLSSTVFYNGPMLGLLCVNGVLFFLTVYYIRNARKDAAFANHRRKQQL